MLVQHALKCRWLCPPCMCVEEIHSNNLLDLMYLLERYAIENRTKTVEIQTKTADSTHLISLISRFMK